MSLQHAMREREREREREKGEITSGAGRERKQQWVESVGGEQQQQQQLATSYGSHLRPDAACISISANSAVAHCSKSNSSNVLHKIELGLYSTLLTLP